MDDRPRIMLSKLGLDGHDRAIRLLARELRDDGNEVVVLGIGATPQMVARAAVDEDVAVIGISILSGAHLTLVPALVDALAGLGAADIPVVVGGTIPPAHKEQLLASGVVGVMPTGAAISQGVDALVKWARHGRADLPTPDGRTDASQSSGRVDPSTGG